MNDKHNTKKEPWRMAVGIIAIACIVYMWAKKDIMSVYAAMPREQVVPLVVTTILVSLMKVAAVAGGILLLRWIVNKRKKK